MYYYVSLCTTMYYYVQLCTTMDYSVQLCNNVYNYILPVYNYLLLGMYNYSKFYHLVSCYTEDPPSYRVELRSRSRLACRLLNSCRTSSCDLESISNS